MYGDTAAKLLNSDQYLSTLYISQKLYIPMYEKETKNDQRKTVKPFLN